MVHDKVRGTRLTIFLHHLHLVDGVYACPSSHGSMDGGWWFNQSLSVHWNPNSLSDTQWNGTLIQSSSIVDADADGGGGCGRRGWKQKFLENLLYLCFQLEMPGIRISLYLFIPIWS